jgi:hypothetical protein
MNLDREVVMFHAPSGIELTILPEAGSASNDVITENTTGISNVTGRPIPQAVCM